jgi:transposase InsO family protein
MAACGMRLRDYTDRLKQHGIQVSMSQRGNPYDNARCESFRKTLKYEEVAKYRERGEAVAAKYTHRSSSTCGDSRTRRPRLETSTEEDATDSRCEANRKSS